jgi:hypothetical protein
LKLDITLPSSQLFLTCHNMTCSNHQALEVGHTGKSSMNGSSENLITKNADAGSWLVGPNLRAVAPAPRLMKETHRGSRPSRPGQCRPTSRAQLPKGLLILTQAQPQVLPALQLSTTHCLPAYSSQSIRMQSQLTTCLNKNAIPAPKR